MNAKLVKNAGRWLLLLGLVSTSAFATKADTPHELKKLLPSSCIFSGNFTQTKTIKALPQPLRSSGKLFFSCKQGLIWHNETPFLESLIYTNDNLHFRNIPNSDPSPLNGQQHYYLAKFLINLLSADTKQIEKDFLIELNHNHQHTSATLRPSNQLIQKGLKAIKIEKNVENQQETLSITINNTNEQNIDLAITNLDTYPANKEKPCNAALPGNYSCDILDRPQHYQTTDSN